MHPMTREFFFALLRQNLRRLTRPFWILLWCSSNAYILMNYGFVQLGNVRNVERIRIEFPKHHDKLLNLFKYHLLARGSPFALTLHFKVKPIDLLRQCRIIVEEDFDYLEAENDAHNGWDMNMVAAETCREFIYDEVERWLPLIGTEYTIIRYSSEFSLTDRQRLMAMYRLERKITLVRNGQFLDAFLGELLPCTPVHMVTRPSFIKKINALVSQYLS